MKKNQKRTLQKGDNYFIISRFLIVLAIFLLYFLNNKFTLFIIPLIIFAATIMLIYASVKFKDNKKIKILSWIFLSLVGIYFIYSLVVFEKLISLYKILVYLAVLILVVYLYKYMDKYKASRKEKIVLIIYVILGCFIGAKYYTFISNPAKYNYIFNFTKVTLSSYGALLGIIIMLFVYSKQFKFKFLDLLYMLIMVIPLMYSIGKLGCFSAGCCYGIKYNGLFSVVYHKPTSAPPGVGLFPIQLWESIVFALIFVFLLLIKEKHKSIENISYSFILCGFAKFSLEFLRASHENVIISKSQILSLTFVLLGIIILVCGRIKCKER